MKKKSVKGSPEKKPRTKAGSAEDKAGKTRRKKTTRSGAAKKTVKKPRAKKAAPQKEPDRTTAKKKTAKKTPSATAKSAPQKAAAGEKAPAAKTGGGNDEKDKLRRRRAEAELHKNLGRLEQLSEQGKNELIHELGTHQIELEIQNEELRRAQAELEESRARLADLYNQAPVGYFTFNSKGRITSVNLTGAAMLGITREKLVNNIFPVFIHWEDSDKFHLHLRAVLQKKKDHTTELRLRPGGGIKETHVRLESIPVTDEQGSVYEIRSTVRDITSRKEAQEKQEKQNALLRTIIDHTDVLMAYLDPDFNFIWVNRAYAASCKMDPSEMAGRNHFDLFPDAGNKEIFRKVRDTGQDVFYKDKPFRYKDQPDRGLTHWDWTLAPVKNDSGLVTGLVLSLRETTPYMKMQLALAESEQRFRSMAETSTDIIFQIDQTGSIKYVSPAASALGYTLKQVKNRPFDEFVMPEDLAEAETVFQKVMKGDKVHLFEVRLLSSSGEEVDYEINATPIVLQDQIIGIQGVARDISERKLAERKIRQTARFPAENPFPVMRINREGTILYSNDAGLPLLKHWGSDRSEAPPPELGRIVTDVLATGAIREVEQTCGEKIFALFLVPIPEDGFVNIYGLDISERKKVEENLRRSQTQLETTLNNLSESVIVSDPEGNLVYWNPSAIRLFGFTAEEEYLRAASDFQNVFELSTQEEGVLSLEQWPINRILRDESIRNLEITVKRRDSDWERIFNFSGILARDINNNPLQAILVLSDITAQKLAEKNIQLRNAMLSGINRIFRAGMECGNDEELAQETLMIVGQLIKSGLGFIGEIGPDGLLHDIAVSDTGWSQCAMADQAGHRQPPGNFRLTGLYGKVLTEGKPLLTNDPEVHPALTSFLGVPLIYGEKTVGLMALANKKGGFVRNDAKLVTALAGAFVETLFKCRTERALAESEKRESSNAAKLKQFFDFTPVPVWIAHDPECRMITGNLAGARLLGLEPDANVSLTANAGEEVPPLKFFQNGRELAPEELPLQRAVMENRRIENLELDLIGPDGNSWKIAGAATPLFDDEGTVMGGIAAYVDITELKNIEEQLRQAKQEWEMTFDAVPDLIALLDGQHRIVRVNRAMADRLGQRPSDLVGKNCYACCHGTSEPRPNCPHTMTVRDGLEHKAELLEERLGGYYLVTTTPLLDEQGNFARSIHVARDITAQKKAEHKIKSLNAELQLSLEQLESINQDLQRSNEDLQHFASIVSHDLREPLRTVSSFVQLLARRYQDKLDDKGIVFMEHIIEGTGHMQRQLNDLLSYSRVGGGTLEIKPVNLEQTVKDIKRKLDRKIKENRAEVKTENLPEVYGDEMQLFTLFQNLFSNALKYHSDKPPRIMLSARQDKEKKEWTLCIRDNGIGFDQKHAKQIFLIFQRLHLRHEYEGTGIGLAICKKIVERHGGRIWAESEPGRGAAFYFTLPNGFAQHE